MVRVSKTRVKDRASTWKLRWSADRRRHSITWTADEAGTDLAVSHIEHLIECGTGELPHVSTREWLAGLPDHQHAKLVGIGGTEPRKVETKTTLADLYAAFLKSRTSAKQSTKATYRQAWRVLSMHFGEDRPVDSIKKTDAAVFREWLATKGNLREGQRKREPGDPPPRTDLDRNTVNRRIGICRQFFNFAKDAGMVDANPFKGMAATVHANPERFHYVDGRKFYRVIAFCPDATMRGVVALNRLIGLRVPSEIRTLTWADVNLSEDDPHLRITAPKTRHHRNRGLRKAPIFPSLRPFLEDLQEIAKPGIETALTEPVFPRFAEAGEAAIRSAVNKILKRAKIEPWPNLFNNCRKSCVNDLLNAGNSVVDVADWMGNSAAVIWEFYAMAMAENRRRAATATGGPVREQNGWPVVDQPVDQNQEDSPEVPSNQPREKQGETSSFADSGCHSLGNQWAMRDSNPRHSRCKRDALAN